MKIKALNNFKWRMPDGHINVFGSGNEYDLPEAEAKTISAHTNLAKLVTETEIKPHHVKSTEVKVTTIEAENKMLNVSYKNEEPKKQETDEENHTMSRKRGRPRNKK